MLTFFRSARTSHRAFNVRPVLSATIFPFPIYFLLLSSSPLHKSIFFLQIFSSFSFSVFSFPLQKKVFFFHTWDLSRPTVAISSILHTLVSKCRKIRVFGLKTKTVVAEFLDKYHVISQISHLFSETYVHLSPFHSKWRDYLLPKKKIIKNHLQ